VELGSPIEGCIKFIVGYSGWEKDQLGSEIARHDWAVLNKCGHQLLMGDGDDDQWRRAVSRFGDRYHLWLNLPSDPTNN
jgi:putative transcriptional regulator